MDYFPILRIVDTFAILEYAKITKNILKGKFKVEDTIYRFKAAIKDNMLNGKCHIKSKSDRIKCHFRNNQLNGKLDRKIGHLGNIRIQSYYHQGRKEGLYMEKKINDYMVQVSYRNGEFDGNCLEYDLTSGEPHLLVSCSFLNGRLHGLYQEYDISGRLMEKGWYEKGYRNGPWKFRTDEDTYLEGIYIQDKLDGQIIETYMDGSYKRLYVYMGGVRIY